MTNCSASPKNNKENTNNFIGTTSVMRENLGDSVCNIIMNSKRIKAEAINITDKSKSYDEVMVSKSLEAVAKFIITNPEQYNDALPVYGRFMPNFILTFYTKKENIIVKMSLGLRQWKVYDAQGKEIIKTKSLYSNDMLRLAEILFPGNEYVQSIIKPERK